MDCEIILPNLPNRNEPLPSWCPQAAISIPPDSGVLFENGLAITRDALAWALTAVYGVYLISGGIAWWRGGERDDDCGTGTEMRELR
jgi:hypothetical protein